MLPKRINSLVMSLVVAGAAGFYGALCAAEPITPREVTPLFNGKDLTGLTTWHKDTQRDDPRRVFRVTDGMIHLSGEGNGYVATEQAYRNYRLVVEYQWGKRTDGGKYVRNSGILLHATGPDGGAGGAWPSCIECQLAQGCAGDIIVIRGKDAAGQPIPVEVTAETEASPKGNRRRWKEGGERLTFPPSRGQLWWNKHDWDFAELIDTRGKDDVESPLGEWNRVEIVADGEKLSISINGHKVNECVRVQPAAGKILLQTEGFEIFFRKFELQPLANERKQAELPAANTWTEIATGSVGPRESPALVWSAERRRFVMIGGTISHAHKPPFPYDVLSLDLAAGQWENELPPGGEKWGGVTGPVAPPGFKSPYFEIEDVEGNIRPWQRHAHLWYLGQLAPWNGQVYTLNCGRTLSYDVNRRVWNNLQPPTSPAPETKSTKEGLNWSAMCPDPVNQELVLFGGCGLRTGRADPGTWVYATKTNEWRQLVSSVQPPPRALSPLVYDPATKKIVLFGGDQLDTLLADTWVYDCASRSWQEHRPVVSPSPRFGHALLHLPKSGKIVLVGGIGYTSSTDYLATLYRPLPFEIWTYDVAAHTWSLVKRFSEGGPTHFSVAAAVAAVDDADHVLWWGPKTSGSRHESESRTWLCRVDPTVVDRARTVEHGVPNGTVTHRTGPFDPAWYTADVPPPDAAAQEKFYRDLPANRWMPLEAPKWPVNRQGGGWSTVAYDTDKQQLLHLSGGHSSYFGNDVAHFDTTTSRWSISYRPQLALDFNYDLSGPGPWAFNGGPWGNHNYHAYAYDSARRRLVYLRNEFTHFYNPERRQWSPDERLVANPFSGSKYTAYLTTTPAGVVLWSQRKESQFAAGVWKLSQEGWTELATSGDPLPLPVTDGSTITFDGQRNRLLLTTTSGEKGVMHSGQVWACDLASGAVTKLNPTGREKIAVQRFARESVYLPKRDQVLIGCHLHEPNRLPLYDAAGNRWLTAEVPGSEFFRRPEGVASVDLGLAYDSARDLVWGVMCNLRPGSVQVLRLDDTLTLTPLD